MKYFNLGLAALLYSKAAAENIFDEDEAEAIYRTNYDVSRRDKNVKFVY